MSRVDPPVQSRLPGAAAKPLLYTIGYEGRGVDDLLGVLRAAGVRHLADVRELPASRRPGFGKTALATAVEAQGLRYSSRRELGAPRDVRHRYRAAGDWEPFSVAYLEHIDAQAPAVAALADEARREPTAILCYEASAADCHRGLLARRLAERHGLAIAHL